MAMHVQWVDGQQVWYNTLLARWVDAIGPDILKYLDHFTTFTAGDWTITETGAAGTEALSDGAGGLLLLTSDALDNDSIEMQKVGESWKLTSGKELYFGCRFKAATATQSDILVGLCITDTTLIDGLSDGVYFQKDDGDANIDVVTIKGSSSTKADSGVDLAADTYVTVEFFFDGAAVVFMINGVVVATHTTYVPDTEELTVSIAYQNGEAGAVTMTVDWVRVIQNLA